MNIGENALTGAAQCIILYPVGGSLGAQGFALETE